MPCSPVSEAVREGVEWVRERLRELSMCNAQDKDITWDEVVSEWVCD
jgi:hypothetical protein